MGELDAIPPPPRPVRWGPVLRHRWVLGLLGCVLLLISAFALTIFATLGIDLLPLKDDALDAEHRLTEGHITAVEDAGLHSGSTRFVRVHFAFDIGDRGAFEGYSFGAQRDGFAKGQTCVVEYLADAPEVARVRGTRRNPLGTFWSLFTGGFFLPAIALTLFWLRGVMGLRLLISTGRLTLAHVVERRPVPGVNPPQWRVDYEFLDERGQTARGSHWVGRRTPLGARLENQVQNIPVIHAEGDPTRSRLVHKGDFRR